MLPAYLTARSSRFESISIARAIGLYLGAFGGMAAELRGRLEPGLADRLNFGSGGRSGPTCRLLGVQFHASPSIARTISARVTHRPRVSLAISRWIDTYPRASAIARSGAVGAARNAGV
jgi:hypothetical protein